MPVVGAVLEGDHGLQRALLLPLDIAHVHSQLLAARHHLPILALRSHTCACTVDDGLLCEAFGHSVASGILRMLAGLVLRRSLAILACLLRRAPGNLCCENLDDDGTTGSGKEPHTREPSSLRLPTTAKYNRYRVSIGIQHSPVRFRGNVASRSIEHHSHLSA